MGDAGVPLVERQFGLGNGKRLGDRDIVLRALIPKAFLFVAGDPIMKSPAGTTIISGQSLAHSLKASPGFSARSASGFEHVGPTFAIRKGA